MASSPKTPRGHSRQVSHGRVLPRRSTRGPLDSEADDPLSPAVAPSPGVRSPSPAQTPTIAEPAKDFSFLLRRDIYHSLIAVDTPPPFRSQPPLSPEPSLHYLLQTGHFRAAAQRAATRLTTPPPPSPSELFHLLYVRLACLLLLAAPSLAATESHALGDLHATVYHDGEGRCMLPWELRVLATSLRAVGEGGDVRRSVEGYYDLAVDARKSVVQAAKSGEQGKMERQLWEGRLRDLGVRVANGLVEMGEWQGAREHLENLRVVGQVTGAGEPTDQDEGLLQARLALLSLRIGDVEGARRALDGTGGSTQAHAYAEAVRPLLSAAEGNYNSAAAQFRAARAGQEDGESSGDTLAAQNLAVCALYTGRMAEARELLEVLVERGIGARSLLFNLTTVYELCTEKSRALKEELAERVASWEGSMMGWERGTADFKLVSA